MELIFCSSALTDLEIKHIEEEDEDLLVLFPKGKQYQYGEARMGVMMQRSSFPLSCQGDGF